MGRLGLVLLLVPNILFGGIRFNNTSSDYMDHGSGSTIDDLDAMTVIFVLKPYQDDQTGRRFMYKTNGGASGYTNLIGNVAGTDGRVVFYKFRATTDTICRSSGGDFTVGSWTFLAHIDADGTTPQIWIGTYPNRAAEVTYAVQQTGSGAIVTDAAGTLQIGARSGTSLNSDTNIACVIIYDEVLPEAEVLAHQWRPYPNPAYNCVLYCWYGLTGNATGIQADWSGNGNHGTPTGTLTLDGGAPIGPYLTSGGSDMPYVVTPASGTAPGRGQIIWIEN